MAEPADQPQQISANPQRPDSAKEFSLKPIEQQMLQFFQDQYFASLSNFLSFLCLERLAHQVTGNTKFEVTDGKLYVWEAEPAPAPDAPAVATGADTKDAIGGQADAAAVA